MAVREGFSPELPSADGGPDSPRSQDAQHSVGGFEPRGLPGYRVFRDPAAWSGCPDNCWWFTRPSDVPHAFEWDDATQDHTRPVFNDWAEGPRKTAKGAVAAAHQHHEWTTRKLAGSQAEGR
jgi:hypothetical protein